MTTTKTISKAEQLRIKQATSLLITILETN